MKELQTVVVQGKAKRDEADNVTILASKVYVQPDDKGERMSAEVDIKQLAIVREAAAPRESRRRRHFVTRYFIPGALLVGFASLVAWASRDALLPPRDVWVIPVLASQSAVQSEGTPLFQAAGWVEPRPTPIRVAALAPGVVERLLVVQDQQVKAGEPVAELVKADAQLAYDRAVANLSLREAEVSEANAALAGGSDAVREASASRSCRSLKRSPILAAIDTEQKNLPFELRRAEAKLEFAETNYERKQSAQGAVSGLAIAEAQSELDAAKATVEELRNRADSLAKQAEAHRHRMRRASHATRAAGGRNAGQRRGRSQSASGECASWRQARVALAEAKLRLDRMTDSLAGRRPRVSARGVSGHDAHGRHGPGAQCRRQHGGHVVPARDAASSRRCAVRGHSQSQPRSTGDDQQSGA